MAVNGVLRAAPSQQAIRCLLLVAIAVYMVQMTAVAAALFGDPSTAAALADAAFAALWGFALVRAVSCSLAWVASEPDLRLLGALPVTRSAIFAVQYVAVTWDVARAQLLSAPFLVGYAIASRPSAARVVAYIAGWTLVMLAGAGLGTVGGVIAARWLRPARARATFRLLSLVCVVVFFAAAMRAADIGALGARHWLSDADGLTVGLAWAPTSWVGDLLIAAVPGRLLGLAAFTGLAVWLARAVFCRWFDLDASVSGAYDSGRRPWCSDAGGPQAPRSSFTAVIIKDLRCALRSSTTLARWAGPIALALVFARVAGGNAPSAAEAAVTLNVVAMVASLVVSHTLATDEADVGWVIRVNARALGVATLAKIALAAAIVAGAALAAVGLYEGVSALAGRSGQVVALSVGYASFGIGLERLMPRPRRAGRPRAPGVIGILGRQVYLVLATAATVYAPFTSAALLLVPVAVGLGLVAAAERAVSVDRRQW